MFRIFIRKIKFYSNNILTDKIKERGTLILIAILVTLFCLPIIKNPSNITTNPNFSQQASYAYFARSSIIEHHQFPLRCPYFGGGYPLIANPQDWSLSPLFIILFIFGEVIGFKILIITAYFICAFSMYYLTRHILQFSRLASLFSSLTLVLSGFLPSNLNEVRISKIYYYFVPLLLIFLIKGRKHKRFIIYSAFLFTVILAQGGLAFIAICLFLFVFLLFFPPENGIIKVSNLKPLVLALAVALLLGAVKIFPMIELLRQNSRAVELKSLMEHCLGIKTLFQCLYDRKLFSTDAMYVGYVALFLPVIAFILDFRRLRGLLIVFFIIIAVSFGPGSFVDISALLWRLPIFHSMNHLTKYYLFFLGFLLSLALGFSINMFQRKIHSRTMIVFIFLALVLNTWDIFTTNIVHHINIFSEHTIKREKEDFSQAVVTNNKAPGDVAFLQYFLLKQNIGIINWYGNILLRESAKPKYFITIEDREKDDEPFLLKAITPDPGYRGELFFVNNSNNLARFEKFTPNSIEIKASFTSSDTLVINQNFDHSWRINLGVLSSRDGLLAIRMDKPGEYNLKLVYLPIWFFIGLAISVIATIACFFILRIS
jgi:hypothetical protein